jgi:hypothetical protein
MHLKVWSPEAVKYLVGLNRCMVQFESCVYIIGMIVV